MIFSSGQLRTIASDHYTGSGIDRRVSAERIDQSGRGFDRRGRGEYSSRDVKRNVLFLCTGNSARSQMAEAIVNARLSEEWRAFSAGTNPAGYVHPMALRVLRELGIEHQGRSKPADEYRNAPFDLVVTVCDSAAETCPVWLGRGQRIHLGFRDPAAVEGSEEEILAAFRAVRDEIAGKVPALL
jgi:arsenate reductase